MAKKVVSYKLNTDGTIPSFIEDGGHLAINPNDTTNMLLFGITKDGADISSVEGVYETEEDLFSFVNQHLSDYSHTAPSGVVTTFVLRDKVEELFSKVKE